MPEPRKPLFSWAGGQWSFCIRARSLSSAAETTAIIQLRTQAGLVPIGMDPATRLWECCELRGASYGKQVPATIESPR